jgi:hypothetical protein
VHRSTAIDALPTRHATLPDDAAILHRRVRSGGLVRSDVSGLRTPD